jgi:hypothetical protein
LPKAFRNGFHSAFSIPRAILKEGIVLPIIIKVQGLYKWEPALKGEGEEKREKMQLYYHYFCLYHCHLAILTEFKIFRGSPIIAGK